MTLTRGTTDDFKFQASKDRNHGSSREIALLFSHYVDPNHRTIFLLFPAWRSIILSVVRLPVSPPTSLLADSSSSPSSSSLYLLVSRKRIDSVELLERSTTTTDGSIPRSGRIFDLVLIKSEGSGRVALLSPTGDSTEAKDRCDSGFDSNGLFETLKMDRQAFIRNEVLERNEPSTRNSRSR